MRSLCNASWDSGPRPQQPDLRKGWAKAIEQPLVRCYQIARSLQSERNVQAVINRMAIFESKSQSRIRQPGNPHQGRASTLKPPVLHQSITAVEPRSSCRLSRSSRIMAPLDGRRGCFLENSARARRSSGIISATSILRLTQASSSERMARISGFKLRRSRSDLCRSRS